MAPRNGIQLSLYETVYRQPFQAMTGMGDMHVDQVRVNNCVLYLSQTLAVSNDLPCIRDLSPTGSLQSSEPGDKVLLKTGRTGFPESQLEEKCTGPWDI